MKERCAKCNSVPPPNIDELFKKNNLSWEQIEYWQHKDCYNSFKATKIVFMEKKQ